MLNRIVIAAAVLGSLSSFAVAHPPPKSDLRFEPWFESLRQPGTGMSCCSMADCRATDFRIQGGQYQARVMGKWEDVPPSVVLRRTDNPTGRAIVCYTPYRGIMCFVRGPEA
jgi:hypothetical protein